MERVLDGIGGSRPRHRGAAGEYAAGAPPAQLGDVRVAPADRRGSRKPGATLALIEHAFEAKYGDLDPRLPELMPYEPVD